ncbi:hypothetical protein DAPPUDRAFT_240579 [Daphnia pulex]|uniref:Uncharacterized protein n=1 Tax=Daphnia pulex TaxID=6669 RepID=E9GBW2_DAPPU|nr:hypothetical protein DAPPUDRAFT_240579 [Daphnia pulex]|eukprot:EFX83029.1 hypothetical protein DAPPUDRAFT_240579 [Daphnia pulex]
MPLRSCSAGFHLRGQVLRSRQARDGTYPRQPGAGIPSEAPQGLALHLILVLVGFEQHNNKAGNEPNNSLAFRDLLVDLNFYLRL